MINLNFDDLPNRAVWEDVVTNMVRDKFSQFVDVYNYYCKHGSECLTLGMATRLKIGEAAPLAGCLAAARPTLPTSPLLPTLSL